MRLKQEGKWNHRNMERKEVMLAGESSIRPHPIAQAVCMGLLPGQDKTMARTRFLPHDLRAA